MNNDNFECNYKISLKFKLNGHITPFTIHHDFIPFMVYTQSQINPKEKKSFLVQSKHKTKTNYQQHPLDII